MKCPACDAELSRMTANGVAVDVCKTRCGGIWFDGFEVRKFDEPTEPAGDLLAVTRARGAKADANRARMCPSCVSVRLHRHFWSVKRQVAVDECPQCGGYWLDGGELLAIRSEYATEKDRVRAAEEYFEDVFGPEFRAQARQSEEALRRARRVAHMFRFICPSYYIPGKQDWGAF
ncbi:MAG TPA: zf-TFIIB domain-containing protein [Methylomirabilota bacterium]|nr:zf-TFIIB domain-containing protein [Methylomirabilota bacterium]